MQFRVFAGTVREGIFTRMWGLRNIPSFSVLGSKLSNCLENPLTWVTMGVV